MTQHAAFLARRASDVGPHFRRDAIESIAHLGPLALRSVPASATMHFGAWLGWPAWLREGTSLTCTGALPARIMAADDLLIIANVLDRHGHAQILRQSLQGVRYPVGPLAALALANAPTLADALRAFTRLVNLHRDYFAAELLEDGDAIRLVLHRKLPPNALCDVLALLILTLAYRLVASYSFSLKDPVTLHCSLPRSNSDDDLWNAFDCRLSSGAKANALEVAKSLSATPNELADFGLWQLALEQITDKERQRSHPSAVGSIRSLVADALSSENRVPRLKEFGGTELSERTIARHLAAHGTSFHTIVDEERRLRAAILINDPSLSLAQVAERLGFNDMSSFGRSFRNWFGMSPGKFRTRSCDKPPW